MIRVGMRLAAKELHNGQLAVLHREDERRILRAKVSGFVVSCEAMLHSTEHWPRAERRLSHICREQRNNVHPCGRFFCGLNTSTRFDAIMQLQQATAVPYLASYVRWA